MKLLNKKNWWIWLLLGIVTFNLSIFLLGKLLDIYKKNAWYAKWYVWVLGFLLGVFPAIIMLIIFNIQITCLVCEKLEVPGSEIYNIPYTWIVCFIIPIIGWSLLVVLLIYIHLWYLVKLFQGKGEIIKN